MVGKRVVGKRGTSHDDNDDDVDDDDDKIFFFTFTKSFSSALQNPYLFLYSFILTKSLSFFDKIFILILFCFKICIGRAGDKGSVNVFHSVFSFGKFPQMGHFEENTCTYLYQIFF